MSPPCGWLGTRTARTRGEGDPRDDSESARDRFERDEARVVSELHFFRSGIGKRSDAVTEFVFVRPWWLAAVPAGLALVWWLRRQWDRRGSWESIVDPVLLPHLVVGTGSAQREWPWAAMAVAVIVAATALAGPAFERLEQPVFRSLAARVIALDVSRSMDASDLSPSRMVRARHKVSDLLRHGADGRAGLVVFAGDAFAVAPLTRDADTLVHLLSAIDTSVIPVQGSRPDLGLEMARDLLEQGRATAGEIILVTDGMKGPRTRDTAETIAGSGIRVSVLAVGTEEGAPVRLPEGGFLKSPNGDIVVPGVDMTALRSVAGAGKGRFSHVTADDSDVEWLLGTRIDDPWRRSLEEIDRTTDEWRDEGPWLVLALLPIAALAFRRGWLLGLPLVLSISAPEVGAFEFADLWARRDQQAAQAIERGDTDRAVAVAPDHRWRGTALYRGGRYDESAAAFTAGDSADDHYNRGNALARAGDLRGALEAYDEALARSPGHEDAEHNRKIVESLIRTQPEHRSGEGERDGTGTTDAQGAGSGSPNPGARRPDEELQAGQREQSGEGAPKAQGGAHGGERARSAQASEGSRGTRDGEEYEVDAEGGSGASADRTLGGFDAEHSLTEEQRLAYEQWLRRIPDDPAGLLRRKFALEYRTRGERPPGRSDAW